MAEIKTINYIPLADTTARENITTINENITTINENISQLSDSIANLNKTIDESVANYLSENPVNGGLTTTSKNLLITILRNALYSTNQSENITALETALGQASGDTTIYYSITNTLTNVTNENANTQVLENSSYIANLTASDGYTLDTVTVTMGETDVTSSVYVDGVITISNVTGNIVITASAIVVEEVVDPLYGTFWPPKSMVTDWNNHVWDGVDNFVYTGNSSEYIDVGFPAASFIRLDKLQGTVYIRTLTTNQYGTVLGDAYQIYVNDDGEVTTGGFTLLSPTKTFKFNDEFKTLVVNDTTYYFTLFKYEIPIGQYGYFVSTANAMYSGYFISSDKLAIDEEYKQYYTLFTSDPTDRITEGATEVNG